MKFSLRCFASSLIAITALTGSTVAHADILNGGFENSTPLNNWTITGYAQTVTSSFGETPPQGTHQAYIDNDTTPRGTPAQGAVSTATLESALGLASGTLSSVTESGSPLGTAFNGSAISQSVAAIAGDRVSFTWNFLTAEDPDFSPQNDYAFAIVDGTVHLLGSYSDATTPIPYDGTLTSPSTDDYLSETGYHSTSIMFNTSGTHTVSFGVVNVGNSGITSSLLVDQVVVAPEPGFALPVALGAMILLGSIPFRRKRGMNATA